VSQLELFRQGALVSCSPATNAPLFAATIGGLGLTGMITQAELHLKRISSTTIDTQRVAVRTIEEMHDVLTSADEEYDYTVAWLDVGTERGICLLGNHAHTGPLDTLSTRTLPVPRFAGAFLNDVTLTIFNRAYYTAQVIGGKQRRMRTEQFFFPLDSIRDWNEFYGRSGFLQYQFVVPFAGGVASVRKILETLRKHHITTYLSVFKLFGSALANGLMSFPMPGITVALDVPNTGKPLLAALDMCDQLVLDAGGRVYPAKDARMSPLTFQRMYGHALAEFNSHRDPQFSSSFWRRVMGEGS
jgi:FAD/FMN-containing dehydrogenase